MFMFVQGHAHQIKFVVDWGRRGRLKKANLLTEEINEEKITYWISDIQLNKVQLNKGRLLIQIQILERFSIECRK